MNDLKSFISNLKERHVIKSAGYYLFSSWIVLQAINLIFPALKLPDWTITFVTILVIIGFPFAMIFAWIYDRKPGGGLMKTDTEEDSTFPTTFLKGEHKLAAIMFTDVVDFTKMMRNNEQKALELLNYKQKLIQPYIKKHSGNILKHIGDGTLSIFPSAIEAVKCANEIQSILKNVAAINLRIGINIGEIIEDSGDIIGDGVNIASRIEPHSEIGGVCISKSVYDAIINQPDIMAHPIGSFELKGIESPQDLYRLDITDTSQHTEIKFSTAEEHKQIKFSTFGGYAIALFSVIFIGFQGYNYFMTSSTSINSNSLAVFPFENIRNLEEYDWLKDQFSESLTFKLSHSKFYKIIDRLQVIKALQNYEITNAGISNVATQVGKNINANSILLGSYTIFNDQLQITTKLVNTDNGEVTPLIQETYSLDDIMKVSSDLSSKISKVLSTLIKKPKI